MHELYSDPFFLKKHLLCLQLKIQETEERMFVQKKYINFGQTAAYAAQLLILLTALAFLFSPKRKYKWQRQLVLNISLLED